MKYTVYHNPRCSKSREAVAFLQEQNAEIEIVEYLKDSPTESEIKALLQKLNIPAIDLVRKGEELFKTNYKDKTLSEKEWIKILAENPILIERPVIVKGNKAVIARPTEKINEL
ncbi:MAG: arsenate reductase (glutaredoxin) [Chitinophagales bacterium]|nr:arsenate reductase (glutaredoxin) [Chitinophagales bacterium]MCO5280086.1 arsenate reductase (glutaredoxin) [Chitinophagales bacterium]HRN94061.1 arsenate reductase (glutaredoxin) [Chitinophagales bacterium]HRP39774.1 arsenate reductase (glutaredoxin) [Chitinophagales bacterium]